jgi:hypothetical protein
VPSDGLRGRHAHAEERERGLGDDRRADLQRGDDEHRPSTLGSTCENMIASGCRPMTRAACTYSLLRSTSVEPRTVRA